MSDARSDAELIANARAEDEEAYAELYRRHSPAALRFARSLGRVADADDLVSEAFARVLVAIKGGNGPGEAFRPYLLSAVRNVFYDTARRAAKEQAVDDLAPLAPEVPFVDPVMEKEESRLVATAFGELPERWQIVLWHTEVEGEKPAAVAPLLGISANAVAALAYRAREGLRERYLQAHVASATDSHCRPTIERLAAFTRGTLSRTDTAKVRAHLDDCAKCSVLFWTLADVNSQLGALTGPVVLGGAAAGYSASNAAGGGAAVVGKLRRLAKRRDAQIGAGATATAALIALIVALLPGSDAPRDRAASPTPTAASSPTVRPSTPATTEQPGVIPPATGAATGPASGSAPPASPSTATSAEPPPAVVLAAALEPVGSLVRGSPGVIALTVDRPAGGTESTGVVTAILSLPAGVTLRGSDAGDGWACSVSASGPACTHPALAAGITTVAYIPVLVAAGADDGPASAVLSGPGIAQVSATTSRGVRSAGLGAVFATTGAVTVVAGGSALLSCPSWAWGCSSARNGSGRHVDNNDWSMTPYVEPGAPAGAPAGAALSSATISFGGHVIWAGLYWAGSGDAPAAPTAYVRAPGASGYHAVTPRRVSQVPATASDKAMYQATADVTALASSGTWWVAVPGDDFAPGHNTFAGWAVLAVVSSGGPVSTVAVYDAASILRSGDTFTSTVYGPPGVPATVAFVGWEGDRGKSGDSLSLGGGPLGPSSGNIACSQTDGTPSGSNTFGTDARVLAGTFGSASPAAVTATTAGDTWLLGALAVATPAHS